MIDRHRREQGLLPHIIQAISNLHDVRGSMARHIIDMVRISAKNEVSQRGVECRVRRALRTGLSSGLLLYANGRYKLSISENKENKGKAPGLSGDGYARQIRGRVRRKRVSSRSSSRPKSPQGLRRRRHRSGARRHVKRRKPKVRSAKSKSRSASAKSRSATSVLSKKSNETTESKKLDGENEQPLSTHPKPKQDHTQTPGQTDTNLQKRPSSASADANEARIKRAKKSKSKVTETENEEAVSLPPKKSLGRVTLNSTSRSSRRSRSKKLETFSEHNPEDSIHQDEEPMDAVIKENEDPDSRPSYVN